MVAINSIGGSEKEKEDENIDDVKKGVLVSLRQKMKDSEKEKSTVRQKYLKLMLFRICN